MHDGTADTLQGDGQAVAQDALAALEALDQAALDAQMVRDAHVTVTARRDGREIRVTGLADRPVSSLVDLAVFCLSLRASEVGCPVCPVREDGTPLIPATFIPRADGDLPTWRELGVGRSIVLDIVNWPLAQPVVSAAADATN